MLKHPSFKFDRRRFLGLAAGGVAASAAATAPFAAFAQAGRRRAAKIATIGAGHEGGALGTLFARQGRPVMFSSLHPEQLKELVASAGPTAQAGTVEQAVGFGDVVLLVVPYTSVEQIAKDYGQAARSQATRHRRLEPDRAARRRRDRELGRGAGRGRPRHRQAAARRASRARLQRDQLPPADRGRASDRASRSACRSPATTRTRSRWRRSSSRRSASSRCSSADWRWASISCRERRSPASIPRPRSGRSSRPSSEQRSE